MPRLSWLAYAGNPCCAGHEAVALERNRIASIAWDALKVLHKLGEGASGIIHQALWRGETAQPVALKLFKGALTSDGLPHSEMAACIGAGAHPNLIAVHGKIHGHPAAASGLVMALADPEFTNLAGPPSLESCTRDIYAAATAFTADAVLRMALGIASAAQHLHARGIMHGDLYAHNILHGTGGHAWLGDFGAASFFAPQDTRRAHALQRIEVRAFACLLEELLQRCDADGAILQALAGLQTRCAQDNPAARPLFADIRQQLQALQTAWAQSA